MRRPKNAEGAGSFRAGKLALLAGAAAVIVLGGYLAASVALRAYLDPASLADRLEPRVSAALNRPISIGSARLTIFPRPSVRLSAIRVENLGPFSDLPLATVDEIQLDPRLLPLFRRRVEVDRIVLASPRILLHIDEQGRTNFGDFVPSGREDEGAGASAISFAVNDFEIRDGRIGYRDLLRGRRVQVDGIRLRWSVSHEADEGFRLAGTAGSDSIRFVFPPYVGREVRGLPLEISASAKAGPRFDWIEIDSGELSAERIGLSLRGRVDSLRSSRRLVDLELSAESLPLVELTAAMSDSMRERYPWDAVGEANVQLTVRGPVAPGVRPHLRGFISVREAGLRSPEGALLEALEGEIQLGEGSARLTRLQGRLLGGQMRASGRMELDSMPTWELVLQARPSLEAASRVVPRRSDDTGDPPLRATGDLEVDATLSGRLGESSSAVASGFVLLRRVRVEGGKLQVPITVPEGRVDLTGDAAVWRDLAIDLGADRVVSTGTLSGFLTLPGSRADGRVPRVAAAVRARRLDLDALRGTSRQEVGYGRIAFARLGGRSLAGMSAEDLAREREMERPDRLPIQGNIRLTADSLLSSPYRLSDVSARIHLSPTVIRIEEAVFSAYGGRGQGSVSAQLGAQEAEPFRLELDLREVRADEFLAQTSPLGGLVQGSLSLGLTVDGGLDRLLLPVRIALQGDGAFDIRDGRFLSGPVSAGLASFLGVPALDTLRFERWTSPFVIRDGAVRLPDGSLTSTALALLVGGAVAFDGGLDLGLLIRPDSAVANWIASGGGAAVGALAGYLGSGSAVEIGVLVDGTASAPRFALDPSSLEDVAREAARDATDEATQTGRDELERRGLDLIRRITGADSAAEAEAGGEADSAGSSGPPEAGADTTPVPGDQGGTRDPESM